MVQRDERLLAQPFHDKADTGHVAVFAVAVVAEKLDHRPRRIRDFPGGQEVEQLHADRRLPAETAAAVDREAAVAVGVRRRDEAEILPQRQRRVVRRREADLDLARQVVCLFPAEHHIGQIARIRGQVEGAVIRDAA